MSRRNLSASSRPHMSFGGLAYYLILIHPLLFRNNVHSHSLPGVPLIARSWFDTDLPAGLIRKGYKTEPDFKPQRLEYKYIGDKAADTLSPGYIFIATMERKGGALGPQIYDTDGNLVWYGNPYVNYRVQDFKVCDYMGGKGNHLCWSERELDRDAHKPVSHKIFVDNTYAYVKNHSIRGDGHEFRIVDDGHRFITLLNDRIRYDLRLVGGRKKGWLLDACVIEYSSETGEEVFSWCYAQQGLNPRESRTFFPAPGHKQKNVLWRVGSGRTMREPWDFAHMNAVDKNAEGDYLASLRHFDSIYKIAGPNSASGKKPGTILWRLGGKSNDFEMDFNFSRQHDVRFVNVTQHETVISLFDNAWDGVKQPTSHASSGKVIRVNNSTNIAYLLHSYPHPRGKLSGSRGSMQLTENGNVFVGWGARPEMSEYSRDGRPLYHSRFAQLSSSQFSYRAFKVPWVGKPYWGPKVLPYSYSCLGDKKPLYAFASWNGATEVRQWRFYKAYQEQGPWIDPVTVDKDGFETVANLGEAVPYVTAEALDANGTVLATVQRQTFVPHLAIKHKCHKRGCEDHFDYNDAASRGFTCKRIYLPGLIPFLVVLIFLELVGYWNERVTVWFVNARMRGLVVANRSGKSLPQETHHLAVPDRLKPPVDSSCPSYTHIELKRHAS